MRGEEITPTELQELIDDSKFLECLLAAGVENWEGFDPAIEIYQERFPE